MTDAAAPDAAPADGAEGGKKRFSGKKLLIILVPIVLLAIGGGAAWFFGFLGGEEKHVEAEAPPPPPPPSRVLNKVDFARLFTQAERIAIDEAAKINPVVRDYDRMLNLAPNVNLDDPDIQAGVPLLEAAQLIGPGRAAQILAGESP